jgi:uncharacterized membrane protein
MLWRKKLVIGTETLREKISIIKEKRQKRNHVYALVLISCFFGSFIVLLVLNFLGALGEFPKNAVISFFAWILFVILSHRIILKIKTFFEKRDQKTLNLIKQLDLIERVWREYFL